MKRIMIISLIMLILLGVTAVSAQENATLTDAQEDIALDVNEENSISDESEPLLSDSNEGENATQDASINFYIPSEVLAGSSSLYIESSNPSYFEGEASVYLDSEFKSKLYMSPLGMGYQTVDITSISEGHHICNIVYEGDSQYSPFNRTFEFDAKNIIISAYERMDQTDSIRVGLVGNATGTVTITVNGSKKSYDVSDYYDGDYIDISYKLKKLKCGETYDVEIAYSGNYGNLTRHHNITITYYMSFYTSIYGNLNDYIHHSSDRFIFFIVAADGDIQVLIDGVDINYDKTRDIPGTISRSPNEFDGSIFDRAPIWLDGMFLSEGNHTVELRCLGNSNYPAQSITDSFYLESPLLRIGEDVLTDCENTLKFLFSENMTGNVSLYLSEDGKSYRLAGSKDIVNRTADIKFSTSKIGKNYMKVVTNTNQSKTTFNAVGAKLKYARWFDRWISATSYHRYTDTFNLECSKNAKGTFYIYIKDASGKKKLYKKVKIKKGSAKIKVPNTAYSKKVGEYQIVAVWKTNYGKESKTSDLIFVEKAQTSVKAPKVSAKYGKSKYFNVSVNDIFKKPVKNLALKVKIGKITYKIKTNKKGVAKFNTKSLNVGTHKVKITSGNPNYDVSAKSAIVVKR